MNRRTIKKHSATDRNQLKAKRDQDIDFSDMPRLDKSFFENAELRLPKPKKAVSIRLDPDVLAWYRKQGQGYQTRINAILRMYMEANAR